MNSAVGPAAPDTQAPAVTLKGPASGATVSQSVTLQASASDNVGVVGVQFLLDGVPLGAEDTTAPYSFSWNTATATRGAHTLAARARDAAGNITTSTAQPVTVVPKLTITSPSGNPTITSTTLNVTYTTSGDMTGIDHVHFVLDGGPELSDPTVDGSFQLTNLTAGPHTLTGFVLHSAPGESGSVTSFSVVLADTTPPSVTLTSPSDGSTVSGTIQLSANALDNVAVAGVQFLLDGAPLGGEDTTAPYSATWNTTSVANGQHVLSARARDASGNEMTSSSVNVTVTNVAPSGLVLALGFNEGSGTTAADASGNGHTGTIGTASWSPAGRFGNALSFNGSSSMVTVNDSNSLDLTTGMTLEAWVNPSVVNSAWRDVIYKGNDNYFLEATSNNGSRPVAGAIVNGSYAEAYGSSALAVNTWTHLAETYDGSAVRLYINGVLISSSPATGALATSSNPLQIGGDTIYGQHFAGLIDEVRIYNRALSASEILADMNSAVGPAAPGPALLTAGMGTSEATSINLPRDFNSDQGVDAENRDTVTTPSMTDSLLLATLTTSVEPTTIAAQMGDMQNLRSVDSQADDNSAFFDVLDVVFAELAGEFLPFGA
jgi:hypothetical protein